MIITIKPDVVAEHASLEAHFDRYVVSLIYTLTPGVGPGVLIFVQEGDGSSNLTGMGVSLSAVPYLIEMLSMMNSLGRFLSNKRADPATVEFSIRGDAVSIRLPDGSTEVWQRPTTHLEFERWAA